MKPAQLILAFVVVSISLVGQGLVKAALGRVRLQLESRPDTGVRTVVLSVLAQPLFWAGLAVTVGGACVYFVLLYATPITKALPVMSAIGYVILFLIGTTFLREHVGRAQVAGLICLIAGIVLIMRE